MYFGELDYHLGRRRFEDGEEVIEHLQENEADIIITDIRMPNLDGLELAKIAVQEHFNSQNVQ